LVAAVPFPPPLLPARHSYWIPSFATSRDTRGHFNMRGSQLLRGAARAAGGYTEKTVRWDSASSGLRGVGDIGHIIVGGVAGAALVFFGLPTLYGSKKPSTFSKEHVNAMRMREHAKVRRYVWGGSRDIDPSAAQTGVSDGRGGAVAPQPRSSPIFFSPSPPAGACGRPRRAHREEPLQVNPKYRFVLPLPRDHTRTRAPGHLSRGPCHDEARWQHAGDRPWLTGVPLLTDRSNKIAPAEYLNPPEVYRQGLEE